MDEEEGGGNVWWAKLCEAKSLSVVWVGEGDLAEMEAGAWHMVVSVRDKLHLA